MALSVGLLRRRTCFISLVLIAVPCIFFFLTSSSDVPRKIRKTPKTTVNPLLVRRLADLEAKLQHLDSVHKARKQDIRVLTYHLGKLLNKSQAENTTLKNLNAMLSPESRGLLESLTKFRPGSGEELIKLPTMYNFLPHWLESLFSLRLAFQLSKGRTGVSVVLGIPSVKREYQTYLLPTLRNLIDSMDEKERADALIVVLIAETDMDYVVHTASLIQLQYFEHLESGLIDVIAPHPSYYPDFSLLKRTLDDEPERVRWRSKQNLDFALLMMYCQTRATFYVQLEDDILARRSFLTDMKNFALSKVHLKKPWFVLVFCQLGFIGNMFKCIDLPLVVFFLLVFFNDKPVDWLLDDILGVKACHADIGSGKCRIMRSQLRFIYKPSLFQHIGTYSSLKGKLQTLKDKNFEKVLTFHPHFNPKAKLHCTISAYKDHTFERAYHGQTYFWGLFPQVEDFIIIKFNVPISVKNYLFRSGNIDHPEDKFVNTTIEAFPVNFGATNVTKGGFVVVGEFDSRGVAQGTVHLGKVKALRVHVHSDSENWVILREIFIGTEVF